MAQYDLNLRDYWRVLRRRKGVVLIVTLAFGALASLFAQFQKPDPIYQAVAVVKFERATTLVGLLVETISLSPGDSLATQASIVRSFPVLERAAKALRLIPPELDSEAIKRSPNDLKTLVDLRDQVKATPEENTTLINITVTSPDSSQAAQLANAVAQAYRDENSLTRSQQIREAHRFIESQLAEVDGRLRAAEEQMLALKERRGFVSLPEETNNALARLSTLQTEVDRVRLIREETAAQIRILEDPRVAADGQTPRVFTDAGNPTIAKLTGTLLDLAVERDNLLVTLTPVHPQIRDLEARINNLRATLVRELRLKLQTFDGRLREMDRQIDQIWQMQRSLPDLSRQYAQVQREITINENLLTLLRSKLQEVRIKEKEQRDEVTLVRPATEPTRPMNPPQMPTKTVLGLLIGAVIGLVLAFVLESMDSSFATIHEVESYVEVPVLGFIPDIAPVRDPSLHTPEFGDGEGAAGAWPFLLSLYCPRSTVAEAYRSLRTNIDFLTVDKGIKTLAVTSGIMTEGKTTTAINLAITLAQMGKRVLLVEADLRKPMIHRAFGVPREPGLAEVLLGNQNWQDCLLTVTHAGLESSGIDPQVLGPVVGNLFVLTSGIPPASPTEFLASKRMSDLLEELQRMFDMILFDCSPVLPVTDATILGSKLDGTLIVHRVGRTSRTALRRAKTLLENVRAKVLGIVLTGVRPEVNPEYEEMGHYYYTSGVDKGTLQGTARPRGAGLLSSARLLSLALLAPLGLGAAAWWHGGLGTRATLERPAERRDLAVPASLQCPPAETGSRPFTLEVASASGRGRSQRLAEKLRARGLQAFMIPAEPGGKGPRFRVLVGRFESEASALESGRELRRRGLIRTARVQMLPYRVDVVIARAAEQIDRGMNTLRGLGYLPVLGECDAGAAPATGALLQVEPFATPEEAESVAARIRDGGLTARVVSR